MTRDEAIEKARVAAIDAGAEGISARCGARIFAAMAERLGLLTFEKPRPREVMVTPCAVTLGHDVYITEAEAIRAVHELGYSLASSAPLPR